MEVTIRDLKAHLSAYLRRVQAGEEITITSRSRPVAQLGPVKKRLDRDTTVTDVQRRLTATVGFRWQDGKPEGGRGVKLHTLGPTAADVVFEERG